MEIKYQIVKDDNLIIQKFYGVWSNDVYRAFLEKITKESDWEYVTKSLSDMRDANIENAFNDIQSGAEMVTSIIKKEDYSNILLVEKPVATAIAHLYKDEVNSKSSQDNNYCSSFGRVIELFNLKYSRKELIDKIDNLKHSFA